MSRLDKFIFLQLYVTQNYTVCKVPLGTSDYFPSTFRRAEEGEVALARGLPSGVA